MEIGDLDEEVHGNRRRSGRLAKTQGRLKQKSRRGFLEVEEEDTNSEESDKVSGDGKEKLKDDTNNKEEEKWDDSTNGT